MMLDQSVFESVVPVVIEPPKLEPFHLSSHNGGDNVGVSDCSCKRHCGPSKTIFSVFQGGTGEDHFWSPKSQCVYGPENEIAAVTFFAKNGAALPKSNTFASVTEWQDSGERGC